MKNLTRLMQLFIAVSLAISPCASHARNCGIIMNNHIKTYGNLSCSKAISVFKAFNAGHTPKGWTCGQSVGGCGLEKRGFTFSHIHASHHE